MTARTRSKAALFAALAALLAVLTLSSVTTKVFPKWGVYGMDEGIGDGPVHWLSDPRIGLSYSAVAP